MGGKRVKGIDDVLYVRGRADFVGVRDNALVRLAYLPTGCWLQHAAVHAEPVPQAGREGQAGVPRDLRAAGPRRPRPAAARPGPRRRAGGQRRPVPRPVQRAERRDLPARHRARADRAGGVRVPPVRHRRSARGSRRADRPVPGGVLQPPRPVQAQAERPHVAQPPRRPLRPRRRATAGRRGAQRRDRAGPGLDDPPLRQRGRARPRHHEGPG